MEKEVIEVRKYMFFQKIFKNINESSCNFTISNISITDYYITYDLITDHNEISVSITIDECHSVKGLKFVEEIIVLMERKNKYLIKKIENAWRE